MDFRPIVAPSIRELFIQQLEGAILSGQLKPGDRLPTERELADTMHISKTVVHEGLRELHRLGFLDIASRRGVTVADYAQTGSLETLMAIMDYHGSLPDEKTARSILRLRCTAALRHPVGMQSDRLSRNLLPLHQTGDFQRNAAGAFFPAEGVQLKYPHDGSSPASSFNSASK